MALHLLRQRALPLLQPQLRGIPSLSHAPVRVGTAGPVKTLLISNFRSLSSAAGHSQPSLSSTSTLRAVPQIALARQSAKLSIGPAVIPKSNPTNRLSLTQTHTMRSFKSSSFHDAGTKAKATPSRAREPGSTKARGTTKTKGAGATGVRAARSVTSRPRNQLVRFQAKPTSVKAPSTGVSRSKYSLDVDTSQFGDQNRPTAIMARIAMLQWLSQKRQVSTSAGRSAPVAEAQRVPPPLSAHLTSAAPQPGSVKVSDLIAARSSFAGSAWNKFY
ncbi:unnamed protein product [Tilletia laevis]|uniref:Uncharacterized protein n=1 Tax=Tilletia laevis TaxID=157183 RepID=A0A9N8L9I2_9BASI|nr:unnamed protein product [Tilletia caries]CAD6901986.1 unnamed protein product [Tilletia laevis]CAD7069099.1 unnamed protein product [Tilletia caries]